MTVGQAMADISKAKDAIKTMENYQKGHQPGIDPYTCQNITNLLHEYIDMVSRAKVQED